MVDVVGRLRVEVSDRVVADRGEMDHGVEADEILAVDVSDVGAHRLDLGWRRPERAGGEEVGVEADDLVARPLQHGHEDGADVAVVAADEDAHMNLLGTLT